MASMSGPMVNGVTTLEAVKRTCDVQQAWRDREKGGSADDDPQ